jgi:bifunctional non-homologous end joining protein LigD
VYPNPVPKAAPKPDNAELLTVDGHQVRISNPAKLYFSEQVQLTKLDIVRYFLSISQGALGGISDRPIVLKRFVDGAHAEPFYQKRAPSDLPPFLRTVTLSFPSGRTADEVVVDNAAGLAFIVNLGCIELHPHPVRSQDLDHPDQLRIDLDPQPGIDFSQVRTVALEVKAVLEDSGLTGFPKTSGSRGIHINVPIHPRWTFTEVRRAALALARAVERRIPTLATSKWWKEERHGVFLDYNQNAKDRTTASAYSVRPLPDARVSAPLTWAEVPDVNPADFTVLTMPARFAAIGDPHAAFDTNPGSLEALLNLATRDESEGLGDAPWPPHFVKQEGEAKRVQPSKAKSFSQQSTEGFGAHRFKKRSKASKETTVEDVSTPPSSEEDQAPTASSLTEDQATTTSSSSPGDSAPKARSIPAWGNAPGPAEESVQRAESPTHSDSVEPPTKPNRKTAKRTPKHPLITIANSPDKAAAMAGLDRWKEKHTEAATHLAEDDILIDRMRGSSAIWYRIRINLRNIPEDQRPTQQTPDPDDDPTRAWREATSQ